MEGTTIDNYKKENQTRRREQQQQQKNKNKNKFESKSDFFNNNNTKSDTFNSNSMDNFYDPTAIKNRLPNVIFSGPNNLYHQRVNKPDYPREIGIGKASMLRSLEADYVTRGTNSNVFLQKRRDYVGEIGWSARYFGRFSPSMSAFHLPNIYQLPR